MKVKVSNMPASPPGHEHRLVGSDRVLAVLIEVGKYPQGVSLDDLVRTMQSPKSTVFRALSSLRRARLVEQLGRGIYILGDEFFSIAFRNFQARPDTALMSPILETLVDEFGETAHYAVLDNDEVVYRAKLDPARGAVRLSSTIGGRNPAYRTAVGKILLSYSLESAQALESLVGSDPLEARTPHTITSIEALWAELQTTRKRGYGIDDQENEMGVNCIAVPVFLDQHLAPVGAVSVSALAFRTPLPTLVRYEGRINRIVRQGRSGFVN